MATSVQQPAMALEDPDRAPRFDAFVGRASGAAETFRKLGQEEVDRIVWAMVVAGLEHAVELAELAMEETHFGVFEDKVVKNYVATEFLYDYLKDKRSVGVIEEDRERAIQYVAEPIGVVLALLPITNPTSTALFKSIVAAKTRNAIIFRPSARAARCAVRAVELLQEAGEAAGLPPHALQVIPDPTLDVSQYLFHHPGIDFIWTTGGPKAVAAANEAGKPCISVGPGNAPVYLHRSADVRMAVVDILISKTFDSSVICPAQQTCVVDDAIYDEVMAEFGRMGARLLTHDEVEALAARSSAAGTGSEVSPAAVVTRGETKVTLVDYSLVPDMAIVDPTLTVSMPPDVTADTGVDALTHALEAAVSIFASPFTDAFCMQAINLILDGLPRAHADGGDIDARTAMANAATIAGLAFSNVFVGVNHALAHAVGARFGIAHGRANAIFLPHMLRYNASLPSKFMPAPGYSAYVAPEKYGQIAYVLGLGGHGESERGERLFARVDELLDTVREPRSLKDVGIAREDFETALPELARAAFADPSVRTNPRIPLLREIVELLEAGYAGH
jgi:alcohol dehydrogenase class IV